MTKSVLLLLASLLLTATPSLNGQAASVFAAQTPASSPVDPLAGSSLSVQSDVTYATINGHALRLDVYDAGDHSSRPRPAVVLIHGGSWSSFDKSTMSRMGMFLANCGFVAFSVDYRLVHGTENLWPAQLDDVQRAVRWIRANAQKYNVDPDHIGAFGHSAGAQLAALLGLEDTRDNSDATLNKYSSQVQAVVDVSGPTDFTTHHDADGDAFFSNFFGGDYAHHSQAWKDASPVFQVSPKAAPFLIVHGSQDQEVPIAQAQELSDKLKQANVQVKFITVEDVHTFRTPEARERLAFESQAFFSEYLKVNKAK